jgi:hypothetical protein
MYHILSGTEVVKTFESWTRLIKEVGALLPTGMIAICLVTKTTQKDCVGKPTPLYALLQKDNKKAPATYLSVVGV